MASADETVHCWSGLDLDTVYMYLANKPDIYRCICSNRDRLGFYAEIQIIF